MSWTPRFARKSAGAGTAYLRSAPRVIAAMRIVRRPVARRRGTRRSAPPVAAIGRARKDGSIIAIINARIGPA
jgi:hypothetical protein